MTAVIRIDRNRLAPLLLLLLPVFLAGCAQPLGPGYRVRRETVTVRYNRRPAEPAVYYTLRAVVRNTGNRTLAMLRIRAPKHQASQAQSSSARPAQSTAGPSGRPGTLPLPLEPPLPRRQSRRIAFSYLVPVRGGNFFLEPAEWFPSLFPPHRIFAEGEPWARRTILDIFVPYGDRALTTGRLRRVLKGRPGKETEYVYQIGRRDFPPFLLIGKYDEQKVRARGRNVFFWTRQPFDSACGETIANEAAATIKLYRSWFGRPGKKRHPLRIIEIAAAGAGSSAPTETVPYGVLFSEDPARVCQKPSRFFPHADRGLAATWFGWSVRPEPGAQAFLGNGVRRYVALLAAEKREGPGTRRREVQDWIAEYDRLSSRAQPLPPSDLGPRPTGDQQRLAGIQSALCFVALEDRLGVKPVRRALRDLIRSLRRSTAGRNELRSALEGESGQNLYDFFNVWLGHGGIPAAFRSRYSAKKR